MYCVISWQDTPTLHLLHCVAPQATQRLLREGLAAVPSDGSAVPSSGLLRLLS